uniref:Uncharacterized protein n=1 Tax=Romanomermis culicivorax TaxID=13658 RepID=A0A915HG86_ROMCU
MLQFKIFVVEFAAFVYTVAAGAIASARVILAYLTTTNFIFSNTKRLFVQFCSQNVPFESLKLSIIRNFGKISAGSLVYMKDENQQRNDSAFDSPEKDVKTFL